MAQIVPINDLQTFYILLHNSWNNGGTKPSFEGPKLKPFGVLASSK